MYSYYFKKESITKKMEGMELKNTGLVILAAGALLLVGTGLYRLFQALITDPGLPVIVKIGITGVIAGILILLGSLIKERIEEAKKK